MNPSGTVRPRFLVLGALGVVFGDIGTSPLYAFKECLIGTEMTDANILGILSLIIWTLFGIVTVKYLCFVMRADNEGQGGIFALLALILQQEGKLSQKGRAVLTFAALFGAALLYGDGILTPAISVLSAVEGLSIATETLEPVVIPLTCLILIALFIIQKNGTERIGKLFGPVMLVWFGAIAVLGLTHIARNPAVLTALSPIHALDFLIRNRFASLLVLGSVFLAVTGGEALYADMGHFGAGPIRTAWLTIAFPALLICYFGQGAFLLAHPEGAESPFYSMVPRTLLYPMCGLATLATVIASQALISGAFSLTHQAIQLGYFPWLRVRHTSASAEGQIYISAINWWLLAGCVALVLTFKNTNNLAAAYGLAVSLTMVLTTVLFYFVATHVWQWMHPGVVLLTAAFLAMELPLLAANGLKFIHGGWLPLVLGVVIMVLMTTWKDGHAALDQMAARLVLDLDLFIETMVERKVMRPDRTAVFLASDGFPADATPPTLLHFHLHTQTIPAQVFIVKIHSLKTPHAHENEQLSVEAVGHGFYRVRVNSGFQDQPDLPQVVKELVGQGLIPDQHKVTYYLEQELLVNKGKVRMATWRKALLSFLMRNSDLQISYLGIPPRKTIVLGVQLEI